MLLRLCPFHPHRLHNFWISGHFLCVLALQRLDLGGMKLGIGQSTRTMRASEELALLKPPPLFKKPGFEKHQEKPPGVELKNLLKTKVLRCFGSRYGLGGSSAILMEGLDENHSSRQWELAGELGASDGSWIAGWHSGFTDGLRRQQKPDVDAGLKCHVLSCTGEDCRLGVVFRPAGQKSPISNRGTFRSTKHRRG